MPSAYANVYKSSVHFGYNALHNLKGSSNIWLNQSDFHNISQTLNTMYNINMADVLLRSVYLCVVSSRPLPTPLPPTERIHIDTK